MLESDPKINKELSPSTFNNHIRRLEKDEIIIALDKNIHKRGQKLFYSLTDSARDKLKMGMLKFSSNSDKEFKIQEKEERVQQVIYKVLCTIALARISNPVEPKQNKKEEDVITELQSIIAELSGKPRKIKPLKFKKLVGVSLEDIINDMSSLIAYWHIIPNREMLKSALDYLKKEKLIKEHYLNNERRYTLSNSLVGNFIIDCIQFFFGIGQFRYRHIWQNIRSPTKWESEYFLLYFPSKDFISQIAFLKKTRQSNKQRLEKLRKENPKEYYKKKNEVITNKQFWDYQLFISLKILKENHSKLFRKYPGIADMLFDIFFPKHLILDIKDMDQKYKNESFPTLIINSNIFGTSKIDPNEIKNLSSSKSQV